MASEKFMLVESLRFQYRIPGAVLEMILSLKVLSSTLHHSANGKNVAEDAPQAIG